MIVYVGKSRRRHFERSEKPLSKWLLFALVLSFAASLIFAVSTSLALPRETQVFPSANGSAPRTSQSFCRRARAGNRPAPSIPPSSLTKTNSSCFTARRTPPAPRDSATPKAPTAFVSLATRTNPLPRSALRTNSPRHKWLKPSALTPSLKANNLVSMRFAKVILFPVVAVLLAAYAFDCDAMATPEQAMQCCNSMPCSSHGHHAQDCCKTMPAMHAPFVQPNSASGVSFAKIVFAVLAKSNESLGPDSSFRFTAAQSHAPPIFPSAHPLPLRI